MHESIASLSTMLLLVLVVAMLAALVRGADALVDGASNVAYRLGLPKVIVGATIVSLGTTSPEAAVSVMAAWSGKPGLALGNAVGSVIADTALIFGVCSMMVRIPADKFVLSRQGWLQFGSAVLLALLCYRAWWAMGDAASLGRPVGIGLLVLLAIYMVMSVRWSQRYSGDLEVHSEVESGGGLVRDFLAIAFGLAFVIGSSHVLIEAVSVLALRAGVPQVVLAATLVAFGTSLPELVVGVASVRQGHPDLLVGNVIGADILNILFVIGASAAAAPLPIIDAASAVPNIFLVLHLPAMLVILALFRVYIAMAQRNGAFSRWMGAPLVLLYVTYTVAQFVVGRG